MLSWVFLFLGDQSVSKLKQSLSSGPIKFTVNCVICVVVALLLLMGMFSIGITVHEQSEEYQAKSEKLREIDAKILAAKEDIDRIERERDHLKTPEGVEDIARERLGMVRPGEIVYVIDSSVKVETSDKPMPCYRYREPEKPRGSRVFKVLGGIIY